MNILTSYVVHKTVNNIEDNGNIACCFQKWKEYLGKF